MFQLQAKLVENIATLARDKRIEGISDLRDEAKLVGNSFVEAYLIHVVCISKNLQKESLLKILLFR